jgi:E3 ubiquitin-protein ligase HUWE1
VVYPTVCVSVCVSVCLCVCVYVAPAVDDLKANTEYHQLNESDPVIQWFWAALKSFTQEECARFIQFATGTSKVPLEGFAGLQGMHGPQKFQIHRIYGGDDRLPTAHTCFNQLDLPSYSSEEVLRSRLLLALREGSEGFGFV